jgi:hypothetical protein
MNEFATKAAGEAQKALSPKLASPLGVLPAEPEQLHITDQFHFQGLPVVNKHIPS